MEKFVLKLSDDSIYTEVGTVEELAKVLRTCPVGAIRFHLRGGTNDFSEWVGKSLGKQIIAQRLRQIKIDEKNPETTRKKLLESLAAKK
jgi:hypothetical protein